MYSAPTGLEELELHAKTRGTGTVVWEWTRNWHENRNSTAQLKQQDIPSWRTATSEAVVNQEGPALGHGSFAIYSCPSSLLIRRALLKPPSILST